MSFTTKYSKADAYAKAKKDWIRNVEQLSELTTMTTDDEGGVVLTIGDRSDSKGASFLREPVWDTRMSEKTLYDVQMLMGKSDLMKSAPEKSPEKKSTNTKPAEGAGPDMTKVSGLAVLNSAKFILNIDASQSELADGMGAYDFSRGKQRVTFKNGRGLIANKLVVRNHKTQEQIIETTREILMVQKKKNTDSATTSRVRREPTYEEIENFNFSDFKVAGCKSQEEVLISDLKGNSTIALCNMFNGFVHHPYHIGLGDHINAAQVVDISRQACNVFLNSKSSQPPEEFIFVSFEINFVSFNELSVPMDVTLSEHTTKTDSKNRILHYFDVVVRQEPRLCSTMKCCLMPLRNLLSGGSPVAKL